MCKAKCYSLHLHMHTQTHCTYSIDTTESMCRPTSFQWESLVEIICVCICVYMSIFVCVYIRTYMRSMKFQDRFCDVAKWSMRMSHKWLIQSDVWLLLLFNIYRDVFLVFVAFYEQRNSAHLACIQYDAILHTPSLFVAKIVLWMESIFRSLSGFNAILIYIE